MVAGILLDWTAERNQGFLILVDLTIWFVILGLIQPRLI